VLNEEMLTELLHQGSSGSLTGPPTIDGEAPAGGNVTGLCLLCLSPINCIVSEFIDSSGGTRERFDAGGAHNPRIFNAHSTVSRQYELRLEGKDHAFSQFQLAVGNHRQLVQFDSYTVA
jgi:hypothetical protein